MRVLATVGARATARLAAARAALAALALLGCEPSASHGPAIASGSGAPAQAQAPRDEGDPLATDPAAPGPCGGLAALELDTEIALLGDRVRVRAASASAPSTLPYGIMEAPPARDRSEDLDITRGQTTLRIRATELFRSSDDLAHDAVSIAGEWLVEPMSADVVLLRPRALVAHARTVRLGRALVRDEDSRVIALDLATDRVAAESGGCPELARRIAATATRGSRRLAGLDPGRHALFGWTSIAIPADYEIAIDDGPDFGVYRVIPPMPLSAPRAGSGSTAVGIPTSATPTTHARRAGGCSAKTSRSTSGATPTARSAKRGYRARRCTSSTDRPIPRGSRSSTRWRARSRCASPSTTLPTARASRRSIRRSCTRRRWTSCRERARSSCPRRRRRDRRRSVRSSRAATSRR